MTSKKSSPFIHFGKLLLGDTSFRKQSFPDVERLFRTFYEADFRDLRVFEKHARISEELYRYICAESIPCFLLPHVIDYVNRVQELLPTYTFMSFEFWLNQYANLTSSENLRIRAKIAGKLVQREDYQIYFPIGGDKYHPGSHYVLAHFSPDIDTLVASYWGWLDAFACRVGEGLHHWVVPEHLPEAPTELAVLFSDIFGKGIFNVLTSLQRGIRITAMDLLTQNRIVRKKLDDFSYGVESERGTHAIILTDDKGDYLGDWRSFDFDAVRSIVNQFTTHLQQMENLIHQNLIALFAKESLHCQDVERYLQQVLHHRITLDDQTSHPVSRRHVDLFIKKVLGITEGYECTFSQFVTTNSTSGLQQFQTLYHSLLELPKADIFNSQGLVIENRPKIFTLLKGFVENLSASFRQFRDYVNTLGCAFEIKSKVLQLSPNYLSHLAELSEIQEQIQNYGHMTVNYRDPTGTRSIMGAIFATKLQQSILATASLRDFSNQDEADIPDCVMPISVIDHHKSEIANNQVSRMLVADVQSCNVLVAELAMQLNDRYNTNGMSLDLVEQSLEKELSLDPTTSRLRVIQKLIQYKRILTSQSSCFISLEREFIEYLHFVYAILDDTDLLTKVTLLDIECVCKLVNRLKSLSVGKEVEVIHFDDIPKDSEFVQKAAKKLQQNDDLHSLYRKVYAAKESLVDQAISAMTKGMNSSLFLDTKTQNGTTAVTQIKLFRDNIPMLQTHCAEIHYQWIEKNKVNHREHPHIDLYLLMITTLTSAEELYTGKMGNYEHKDELWCWYPPESRSGMLHLKVFLQEFFALPIIRNMELGLSIRGERSTEFAQLANSAAKKPFLKTESLAKEKTSLLIIQVTPGSINSRKAKITPCLP